MSLKDDIFAKFSPKPARVEGLNGLPVYAKALSGADLFDLNAAETTADKYLLTVLRGACDADGLRTFSEEDRDRVRELPREFCGPVSDLVLKLSGLAGDAEGKEASLPTGASPSG